MRIRRGVLVIIVLTSTLVTLTVLATPRHESLARAVPGDVGLYIEGQHIDDLLLSLIEPRSWLALAELAGQPARLEEATGWQDLIRRALRMEPSEAVQELFAEQFAFVGEGLGRAQDGVVICRPATEPRTLIRRWAAQPLPSAGRTSVYRVADGIAVALQNGLMLFGAPDVPDGMFSHVLKVADDQPDGASLADNPVYQSLLARISDNPDAILFARLRRAPSAPASAPTAVEQQPATSSAPSSAAAASAPTARAELPGPLHGASNIMLALHRERQLLRFSVVGDAPPRNDEARTGLPDLVSHLPERTLAAWGVHLDYEQLASMLERLPERSILRLTFSMQERSGMLDRLTDALDSATCIAIGVVEPASRSAPAPPLPAVALLVDAFQPEEAQDEFETLLKQSISFYGLMALKAGSQLVLPKIQRLDLDGADAGFVDISALMPGQVAATVSELHVCWALDGRTLIVASHLDWLRQIVAARHQSAPTLQSTLALSHRTAPPATESIITIQTGPLADLGALWIDYFQKTAPQILDQAWWQAQQPGRGSVHLGLTVTELPQEQRLQVTAVEPDTPADGLIRPGDQIVGYLGDRAAPGVPRRFATSQPIREIRQVIAHRSDARWVDLLIERGGTPLEKRIPLPYIDPIQVLRRFIALGEVFQRVVYYEDAPEVTAEAERGSTAGVSPASQAAGGRGFLTVELRGGRAPLFPFSLTPAPPAIPDQARQAP
jgi:hypothetical protein